MWNKGNAGVCSLVGTAASARRAAWCLSRGGGGSGLNSDPQRPNFGRGRLKQYLQLGQHFRCRDRTMRAPTSDTQIGQLRLAIAQ